MRYIASAVPNDPEFGRMIPISTTTPSVGSLDAEWEAEWKIE
jgi:hypothetical protein